MINLCSIINQSQLTKSLFECLNNYVIAKNIETNDQSNHVNILNVVDLHHYFELYLLARYQHKNAKSSKKKQYTAPLTSYFGEIKSNSCTRLILDEGSLILKKINLKKIWNNFIRILFNSYRNKIMKISFIFVCQSKV